MSTVDATTAPVRIGKGSRPNRKRGRAPTVLDVENRLVTVDAYLTSVVIMPGPVDVEQLCQKFNDMLGGVKPECASLAAFRGLASTRDLPPWEATYWHIYERYFTVLENATSDGDEYMRGPQSPCYGPDCCFGDSESDTVANAGHVGDIDAWLLDFRCVAAEALEALLGSGLSRLAVKNAFQAYIDQLVKGFAEQASVLPLSLDLQAYATVQAESYEHMKHWERTFVGTFGSYNRLLERLRKDMAVHERLREDMAVHE